MTLPRHDTRVTYPAGALQERTRVLHLGPAADGRTAVITESTSFHPVDAAWPDQPADTGRIRVGDRVIVEVSPYDLTRGRINFRHKGERTAAAAPRRPNFRRH